MRFIQTILLVILGFFFLVPTANADLVAANFTSSVITVHSNTDNGDVAPLRKISGGSTLLANPNDVLINGDTLYVTSHTGNRMTTYKLSENGDVAPLTTISGGATGINWPVRVFVYNNEIFVTNYFSTLKVFNVGDTGDIAPKRSLDTLFRPYAIFIYKDEIFLSRHPDTGDHNQIYVFDVNASGGDAAKRTITGPSTGLNFAGGIAVVDDEIYVGNDFGDSITVYDVNASGDAAPKRTIAGASTQMDGPLSIAICSGEIYVANRNTNVITVYNTTDFGDVAPKRVISGASTLLSGPMGLAVSCPAPQPPPPPQVPQCFVGILTGGN